MIPNCQSRELHLSGLINNQSYASESLSSSQQSASNEADLNTDTFKSAKYYTVGYLWSWNFMLTKKWRSCHTGDEIYQDKMLADFRAFCSNQDNRLRDYYDDCRTSMTHSDLDNDRYDVIDSDIMDSGEGLGAGLLETLPED